MVEPLRLHHLFEGHDAVAIIGAGTGVLVASRLVSVPGGSSWPIRQVIGPLATAPISTLATLIGKDEAILMAALSADHAGVTPVQSIADLTDGNTKVTVGLPAPVYVMPRLTERKLRHRN